MSLVFNSFLENFLGIQLRAMLGRSICLFHVYKEQDAHFDRQKNINRCIQLLAFLQMLTEIVFPTESLYWIVYNGTPLYENVYKSFFPYRYRAFAVAATPEATYCICAVCAVSSTSFSAVV